MACHVVFANEIDCARGCDHKDEVSAIMTPKSSRQHHILVVVPRVFAYLNYWVVKVGFDGNLVAYNCVHQRRSVGKSAKLYCIVSGMCAGCSKTDKRKK